MYEATQTMQSTKNTCIAGFLLQSYCCSFVPFESLFMAVIITFSVQRIDPNFLSNKIM